MTLKECMLIKNSCYIKNQKMTGNKPTGIVVHSTGAANKTLKRYVQPVKEQGYYETVISDIGTNAYNNHWNKSSAEMGRSVCVHAFIGVNAKGVVETYQTLPFDVCCWGVGAIPYDKNGRELSSSNHKDFDHYGPSYNYNPQARVQFEICEDNLTDENYFNNAMREAQEFCAYLCKKFGFGVGQICSHKESHDAGYGGNHGDPDHWLKKFGKNMDWFRQEVQKLLNDEPSEERENKVMYRVQIGAFSKKENAENCLAKAKAAGFSDAFIATTSVENEPAKTETPKAPEVVLKVGDKVKMTANAPVYGKTSKFQSWVYGSLLYVREINGSRVVVSTQKTGAVTGAVDKKYLTKV